MTDDLPDDIPADETPEVIAPTEEEGEETEAPEAPAESNLLAQSIGCGDDSPICFADAEAQTQILTCVEERSDYKPAVIQLRTHYNDGILERGATVSDFFIRDGHLNWITPEGKHFRQDLQQLELDLVDGPLKALGDQDCRALLAPTLRVTMPQYERIIQGVDLTAAQFLMAVNPRDARMLAIKLSHDYGINFVTREVVRVYYDIETAKFGNAKNEVPEVKDRNAFISVICANVVYPDRKVVRYAFLNNHLNYETDAVERDIALEKFPSETQMVQRWFRMLDELSAAY